MIMMIMHFLYPNVPKMFSKNNGISVGQKTDETWLLQRIEMFWKWITQANLWKERDTWSTLSLHWNMQPRASKCSKIGWGSNNLKADWSFTLVIPLQASKAAASPFGVKPFKCKIVMFCRQLMLTRDKSPTSVTELYDKFIYKENNESPLAGY